MSKEKENTVDTVADEELATEEQNIEKVETDDEETKKAEDSPEEMAEQEVEESKPEEKKDKKDERIAELTEKYQRTFAEFDNFRKRSEKEKAAMFEIGAKDIIERILPVVDNFERGMSSLSEEERTTPFAEGMDKIYKQLLKALEDAGVTAIEAVGKEFDPDFHNAVMHVEDETLGENIVAEELQKGYRYRESVVRHSMVKVAN